MGDVVELDVVTTIDLPAERILRRATEKDLKHVVVIGWTNDGEFYFASTYAGTPEILYLTERAKHELMKTEDAIRDGCNPV